MSLPPLLPLNLSPTRLYRNGQFVRPTESNDFALDNWKPKPVVKNPSDKEIPPRIISFSSKAVRKIQSILKERRKAKSSRKPARIRQSSAITRLPSVRPSDRFSRSLYEISLPIYKPPRSLPDQTRTYLDPDTKGNLQRKKARERYRARKKSKFIDDSAIESDGEGGDIQSTQTSPDISIIQDLPIVPRGQAKFVNCDLCGLLVSGKLQLNKHRGKKKCRRLADSKKLHKCHTCKKTFNCSNDLNRHKIQKKH